MKVIFNLDKQHKLKQPVAIALGTFDGVHLGHKALINKLKEIQKNTGCHTLVYTFLEHPMHQLCPDKAPAKIMSIPQKIWRLQNLGLDFLVLNQFDYNLATTPPKSFILDRLVKNYNLKYIVVGYDFRFGFQGQGDIELLKKLASLYGYQLAVISPLCLDGQAISSSIIRKLIQSGQVAKAANLLGYPYSISGKVVHGFGRGRKMGYPTANLNFHREKVIPKHGVYLTRTQVHGKEYWGATNIGINPTFDDAGLFLETHLINYQGNLYGMRLKLEFLHRIRGEVRFSGTEELKQQIYKDILWVKNYVYKPR